MGNSEQKKEIAPVGAKGSSGFTGGRFQSTASISKTCVDTFGDEHGGPAVRAAINPTPRRYYKAPKKTTEPLTPSIRSTSMNTPGSPHHQTTPHRKNPLLISKLATTSLIAPLLYRLAIWAWPGENYHLFSDLQSLTLQMCLNLLVHAAPYILFTAFAICSMFRQPASVDPRSRLVAFAGVAIVLPQWPASSRTPSTANFAPAIFDESRPPTHIASPPTTPRVGALQRNARPSKNKYSSQRREVTPTLMQTVGTATVRKRFSHFQPAGYFLNTTHHPPPFPSVDGICITCGAR